MRIHFHTPHSYGRLLTGVLVLLLSLLMIPESALAQRRAQRFKAALIAGVTASQIDGDQSAGYHKVGLQGGLRGIATIRPKQDVSIELLFTQRGCRNQPKYIPEFSTTLNYVEVPVQWHYHDWPANQDAKSPDYYRVHLNVGFSYARLLSYANKFEFSGITPALPDLNSNSFCFLVGASLFVSKHLGFTVRYNRAVNKLYSPGKPGTNYESALNEHFLAFQAMYVF